MKKLLLLCGVTLLLSLPSFADYNSLEFTLTDGTSHYIKAEGLVINVESGNLSMTNKSNEKLELTLASLSSMQFSEAETTGVASFTGEEGEVSVFTADGKNAGTFQSLQKAWEALSPGIYVIRNANGQTVKIRVTK